MDYFTHNISPTIFSINIPDGIPFLPNILEVRWYGLAYLLGFIASYLLLKLWSHQGSFKVRPNQISNFIFLVAIFGVFLGGRLGYVLLYDFENFYNDKLSLFRIWEGGMASHGGFIGVILVLIWYAKKYSVSFWNLSDHIALTASLGIAFGRIANFINGELYGKITSVSWAVIFHDGHPRHPSQLYQSIFEGFIVFFAILLIKRFNWGKQDGALTSSYLIMYALMRFSVEFFREPDSTIYLGWMSKGQLYSIIMISVALFIIWKKRLFQRINLN